MGLNKEYLDNFKFLIEYNIKYGVKSETIKEDDENMDDSIPNTEISDMDIDELPVSYENVEALEKEKKEDLAKKDDLDRVKEIQDLQTQKLNGLDQFVSTFNKELELLKSSVEDIEAIKTNLETIKLQVKEITPPTPEESLEKMAKISGGITIEDYWQEYIYKNEPIKTVVDTESNNNEFKEYNVPVSDIKSFSSTDIKKSFYEYK